MNEKVFIVWNQDNYAVAQKISDRLSERGFLPVVGGGSEGSFHIGQTVLSEMQQCKYAIILIEKIKLGKHSKLSENVMFEWGFLNAYLHDQKKIYTFLIDTNENEMPVDVIGTYCVKISRRDAPKGQDSSEYIADKIAEDFSVKSRSRRKAVNKMKYASEWDKNRKYIFDFETNSKNKDISSILIYSIQAIVCYDESKEVIKKLQSITESGLITDKSQKAVVKLTEAILQTFIETNRFNDRIPLQQFSALKRRLDVEYENEIADEELRFWGGTIRREILASCCWMTETVPETREKNLIFALNKYLDAIKNIEEYISVSKNDSFFGLFYISLISRSVALVCKELASVYENEEDIIKYKKSAKEHMLKSYKLREAVKNKYLLEFSDDFFYEYLEQELALSRIETFDYLNELDKTELKIEIEQQLNIWKKQNVRRNAIFDRIKREFDKIREK